jgi:UV DNA damage repair endonuclease
MTKKIGFACKWIDTPDQVDGIGAKDDAKKYNTGGTTVAWLNRQSKSVAEQKLWDLMVQNIESTRMLIERVGKQDEHLRMVRLSSDILPVYTESTWSYFWRKPDVVKYLESGFSRVGQTSKDFGVRVSFHPGQFCVLASVNQNIVDKSIEEFEYHADMARWMGYGVKFQDMKINIHISGQAGQSGMIAAYKRLSPEARNCITIENEENSYGLDDCLTLGSIIPITLDIHHHWIREAEYLSPEDDRVKQVVDSWRGVRPTMHYSVSHEDYLLGHDPLVAPNMQLLLEQGYRKQKLRAHSNFYWNNEVNKWALSFLQTHDIMCESKGKNLASFDLANQASGLGFL